MSESESRKDISNWEELFDMTYEYLTFLVEQHEVTHDMIVKTTYDILRNAGTNTHMMTLEKVYYDGF